MFSGSDASLVPNKCLLYACMKRMPLLLSFAPSPIPLSHPSTLYQNLTYPFVLSYLSPHWTVRWKKNFIHVILSTQHRRVFSNNICSMDSMVETTQVLIPSCCKSLVSLLLWYSILYIVYILTDSLYSSLYYTRF